MGGSITAITARAAKAGCDGAYASDLSATAQLPPSAVRKGKITLENSLQHISCKLGSGYNVWINCSSIFVGQRLATMCSLLSSIIFRKARSWLLVLQNPLISSKFKSSSQGCRELSDLAIKVLGARLPLTFPLLQPFHKKPGQLIFVIQVCHLH